MSESVGLFSSDNKRKEPRNNEKHGRTSKQQDQKVLMNRKIKDQKPCQHKGSFRFDRQRDLGTRLRGAIKRRPDRPYSEVCLSDDTTYDHFDKFEAKFDSKKQYYKNRLKAINNRDKISNKVQASSPHKQLSPKPVKKGANTNRSNGSKNRSEKSKPKKLFCALKKQAQQWSLATKKPL